MIERRGAKSIKSTIYKYDTSGGITFINSRLYGNPLYRGKLKQSKAKQSKKKKEYVQEVFPQGKSDIWSFFPVVKIPFSYISVVCVWCWRSLGAGGGGGGGGGRGVGGGVGS